MQRTCACAGMFKTLAECDSELLFAQWMSSQAYAAEYGLYLTVLAIIAIL